MTITPPTPARRPVSVGGVARWRLGAALGIRAAVAPAMLYVPIGYLLGPHGLAIVSAKALDYLDFVVWLTLATLGVLAGLSVDLRAKVDRALLLVASTEALTAICTVAAATAWLAQRWALPVASPVASVPLVAGLCAAASAIVIGDGGEPCGLTWAGKVAEVDDVIVIVLGAWLLSWRRDLSVLGAARMAALAVPVGSAIAAAGLLLFERARDDAERGTFVIGVLILLAGAAAYLSLSPLLIGIVAGLLWRWAPGRADEIIRADLDRVHHPLVVLLLLIAGTSVVWSPLAVWLFVPLLLFRLAGKLIGAHVGSRMFTADAMADLGIRLLPCGLIGLALALHFNQLVDGPIGSALVSAVAVAAVAFEAITVAVLPGEDR